MFGYAKDANEFPFDDGEQKEESDASAWQEKIIYDGLVTNFDFGCLDESSQFISDTLYDHN